MQRHLLLDLRSALADLAEIDWKSAGFYMPYWAHNRLPQSPLLGCGTVCCAYGVGTTLPSWKEAGLSLQRDWYDHDTVVYTPPDNQDAQQTLGINTKQWTYIFGLVAYPASVDNISPRHVVAHIDDVLDNWNYTTDKPHEHTTTLIN